MTYLPLKDYGVVGNQMSAALISRLGSVDWCCLPYVDSPSHFGALLDENRGGMFKICPVGEFHSEQRYLQRTNVLETKFETPGGRALITDWMHMDPDTSPQPALYRQIDCVDGNLDWIATCTPRFAYGAESAQAERFSNGILFRGNGPADLAFLHASVPIEIATSGKTAVARFKLAAGEQARFCWIWGRSKMSAFTEDPKQAVQHWRSWAHHCDPSDEEHSTCLFAGPWHDMVTRSGLLVKMLTNVFSGSIVESVSASLPSLPGGSRNYDYRYSWIRDAAFTLQGLRSLEHNAEADAFFSWISDRVIRDGAEGLQAVYTLDGGKNLTEHELPFLSGYSGARPVRIGNLSARQFQLDVFGHAMLAAAHHFRLTGKLPEQLWPRLAEIAEYVCHAWRRPDRGPWELRGKPEHFVVSKVFCWVALHQAAWLAQSLGESVPARWIHEKNILHRTICEQGFDTDRQTFVRAFGDRDLDSATLLIPLVGFLGPEDPRIQGTLAAIQESLSDGVFLHRYSSSERVPESDGAHLVSSFWLVSCLALCGRIDEATDRLAELCSYASPLGLFGEQIEPSTGEPTGNFPSINAHLALINACLYVGVARGRKAPMNSIIGFPEMASPGLTHRKKAASAAGL